MNDQLQKALDDLAGQNASGVPSASEIEQAPDGNKWTGSLPNGQVWTLVKNHINGYTVNY